MLPIRDADGSCNRWQGSIAAAQQIVDHLGAVPGKPFAWRTTITGVEESLQMSRRNTQLSGQHCQPWGLAQSLLKHVARARRGIIGGHHLRIRMAPQNRPQVSSRCLGRDRQKRRQTFKLAHQLREGSPYLG